MKRKAYILEDTFADEVKPDLPGREEQVRDAGDGQLQSLVQRGEDGPQSIASVAGPIEHKSELWHLSGHSSQNKWMNGKEDAILAPYGTGEQPSMFPCFLGRIEYPLAFGSQQMERPLPWHWQKKLGRSGHYFMEKPRTDGASDLTRTPR